MERDYVVRLNGSAAMNLCQEWLQDDDMHLVEE